MSICYIVACYFGRRRVMSPLYRKDKFYFIKEQIRALESLEHDIDTAIFVINFDEKNPSELEVVTEAVNLVHTGVKKTKVAVLLRPNFDFSYGAWDDALKVYAKDFDYSFLIEDDYTPVANNFDKKFIEYIENDPSHKTFYVCQFLWGAGSPDPFSLKHPTIVAGHCGVSNGVISNSAYTEFGPFQLKRAEKDNYDKAQQNQILFLTPFTDKGLKITSTHDKYLVKFSNKLEDRTFIPEIITFGPKDAPELLQPAGFFGVTGWQQYEPRWIDGNGGEISHEQWKLDPR